MKKIITALLGLVCALLIGVCTYVIHKTDNKAPVISVVDESVVYMEDTDTSVLLNAVKATDSKDGDVSDSIKIEKLSVTDDNAHIKAQFVAKDKSNNITKLTVTFGFTPDPNKPVENNNKKYDIVLVNNLGVENLANSYAKVLQSLGHNIISIGLSTDPPAVETVIYVKNEGDGEELLETFPNADIIVGNIANRLNVTADGADVFVILGYQHSIPPTLN